MLGAKTFKEVIGVIQHHLKFMIDGKLVFLGDAVTDDEKSQNSVFDKLVGSIEADARLTEAVATLFHDSFVKLTKQNG